MNTRVFLIVAAIISGFVFLALLSSASLSVASASEASAQAKPAKPAKLRLGKPDAVYRVGPGEPMSPDGDIDSDGKVPIYKVCGFRALGRYSSITHPNGEVEGIIRINVCALERIGATRAERKENRDHEKAHVRGFDHYESTPRRNPAYYP